MFAQSLYLDTFKNITIKYNNSRDTPTKLTLTYEK